MTNYYNIKGKYLYTEKDPEGITVKVTDKEWNRYKCINMSEKHDSFDIAVNLLGVGRIKEAQKIINDGWKLFLMGYKIEPHKNKQGKIIIDRCYIDFERKRYADMLKRFKENKE